jgi:hypothetical protein
MDIFGLKSRAARRICSWLVVVLYTKDPQNIITKAELCTIKGAEANDSSALDNQAKFREVENRLIHPKWKKEYIKRLVIFLGSFIACD